MPHPSAPSEPDSTPMESGLDSFSPIAGLPLQLPSSKREGRLLTATDFCAGDVVEQLLRRSGLTLKEAARQLGVTPSALRQYTRGRRQNPSFQWILRIAELCGAEIRVHYPES